MVYTLDMVYNDAILADDLWMEWRISNTGTFFDRLPVEPIEVPNPDTTDDAGWWDLCLDWHNGI